MNKTIKFFAGALIGAAAGAIAVTLLAPESGDETRTAIQEKMTSLRNQLFEAARAKREELEAEWESYKKAS